jgi:toxin ParE1/3/4
MRLLLTPLAEQDLEEIGDYIAQDNPTRAHSFVRSCRRSARKSVSIPLATGVDLSFRVRSDPVRMGTT